MAIKTKDQNVAITPVKITTARVTFNILGVTPLIYNSVSYHALGEFLIPSKKKSRAERETTLKHDPYSEYRLSVYQHPEHQDGPTRLVLPSRMFKAAIAEAALRVPGAKKTEINQLCWIDSLEVDVYGVPQMLMSMVRSADMNRTPDIRTRAILPLWCCSFTLDYVQPQLNVDSIGQLVVSAGVLCGVGDFRQQKGKGNFGQFEIVDSDDPRVLHIKNTGSLKAQEAALANPIAYDRTTQQLLDLFNSETGRRELKPRARLEAAE